MQNCVGKPQTIPATQRLMLVNGTRLRFCETPMEQHDLVLGFQRSSHTRDTSSMPRDVPLHILSILIHHSRVQALVRVLLVGFSYKRLERKRSRRWENRKEAVQAVGGHRSMVLESFNGGSRQIKMFRPSPDISIDPKYRLFGVCVCVCKFGESLHGCVRLAFTRRPRWEEVLSFHHRPGVDAVDAPDLQQTSETGFVVASFPCPNFPMTCKARQTDPDPKNIPWQMPSSAAWRISRPEGLAMVQSTEARVGDRQVRSRLQWLQCWGFWADERLKMPAEILPGNSSASKFMSKVGTRRLGQRTEECTRHT